MKFKIVTPKSMLVEQTAGEFAATFFEGARSSGLKKIKLQGKVINLERYKNNPRAFARRHLEMFIPAAVNALIDIMAKPNTSEAKKRIIYDAIQERINDDQVNAMGKAAGLPEFENTVLYKPDDVIPKPIIINTPALKDIL